jgi:biopolymer transport protein ExbD
MAIRFDASGHDSGDPEVTADINITPLVDVMLVLLVMLIITIPFQLHSVDVELPVGTPPPQATVPRVVSIAVTPASVVLWNGEPLADREALEARLQQAAALPDPPEIHVQAAGTARYDTVARVLTAAQRLGLQKIGVVGLEQLDK